MWVSNPKTPAMKVLDSMATHYIYDEQLNKDQLFQGDVLSRHPDLMALLENYHPHYATSSRYRYFLVLTQSCDLIRRDGQTPSSPYITIAAVRPVEKALLREAKKYQEWWQQPVHIVDGKMRSKIDLFVTSLIGNNVPDYFYLHEDISLGIHERNCAFLALSVAIKIEHYDLCLKAKIAQLKDNFRTKLGWLVGNMYSRVGTKDWDEQYGRGNAAQTGKDILDDLFVTIDKTQINKCLSELQIEKPLTEYTPKEIGARIVGTKLQPKSTQFRNHAEQILLADTRFNKHPNIIKALVAKLTEDAKIKSLFS